MAFFSEFRKFIARGNVIDLAVGVIIGGAFGKLVDSFVRDLIMPLLNPLIPGGDWRKLEIWQGVKIGSFLGGILDFLIISFVIFLLIQLINKFNKKEEAEKQPTKEEELLREIRDLLKANSNPPLK
jgi:large conductance mechanosensitive channel